MKKLLCIFLLFLSFSFIIGCDSNKPNENSKTEEKENNDGIKDLNR